MKIADKIKIKDKEYMCIQVFLFKEMKIYRVRNIFESGELFITEKDNNYEVITDKKMLNEIYKFLEVKNTDIIIN